jgi:hypothetical protein
MDFFQAKSIVKTLQAHSFPNPEVPTKHLARSEWSFFKHRVDCLTKIANQRSSRPRIIKQVSSSFLKALAPFFHRGESECFTPYTDSSSAWIALALRPLSVKKRITARCSIEIFGAPTYA